MYLPHAMRASGRDRKKSTRTDRNLRLPSSTSQNRGWHDCELDLVASDVRNYPSIYLGRRIVG
jgi:hypothetical protein